MRQGIQGILGKIFKFNKDRGLLDKGFDYNREAGFLMSESLELINHNFLRIDIKEGNPLFPTAYKTHDMLAKSIIKTHGKHGLTDIDKAVIFVDTFIDQFVFGAGACMKMGLPLGTIEELIHIVCDANLQKTGGTTSDGKQKKGTAFTPPDEQIREILIKNMENVKQHGLDCSSAKPNARSRKYSDIKGN